MATTGRKKKGDKKCYVLMVSRYFAKDHIRAGAETFFVEKIFKARKKPVPYVTIDPKLHTVRLNYELWEKRFKEIDAGTAYLSLRYWLDKPYKSPQEEFLRLDNTHGIGIQKLGFSLGVFIDDVDSDVGIHHIAKNDGLEWEDFKSWFGDVKYDSEYVIIHFTDFRYPNSLTEMDYKNFNYTYKNEN